MHVPSVSGRSRPGPDALTSQDGTAEQSLAALVSALTLEQRVRLLTGADSWSLHAEPRAGLRRIVVSDGPAGVRGVTWDERHPSANVPSPTALAATWDRSRVSRLGRLLAQECRRKDVDVLLAPTVNLQRSPYGGRHFEMFSEDPLLTAELGAAYVRGLQSEGIGATAKHFVANDSETDRYSVNVVVDERTLRELYLAPFEVIVREAGVWAVMAAYNQTNGVPMTESSLLRELLQEQWGFDGLTMTDWSAGRSTVAAAVGGLDLMMPGPRGPWGGALVRAVREGRVSEAAVDDKVTRLLRLASRVGALGARNGRAAPLRDEELDVAAELRAAAAAGFVLVRNQSAVTRGGGASGLLPLDRARLRRVAVLGPNAMPGRTLGGGSALVFPPYVISPLAGLVDALAPEVEVVHARGVRAHTRLSPADVTHLTLPGSTRQGVEICFLGADGQPLGREHRLATTFNWHDLVGGFEGHLVKAFRVRTRLRAPQAGRYVVGGSGLGRFVLTIDGIEAFDVALQLPAGSDPAEGLMRPPQHGVELLLGAGQVVDLELLHEPQAPAASFDASMVAYQLNLEPPDPGDDAAIQEAVELAASAGVAVVVVGTNEEVESEGYDRHTLALPGRQDELVRRVAEINDQTIVVVNSGAPVLLPWREQVAAILLTWFPGQEFGRALADVLLGVVEPGGRLPTTWPADEDAPLPSTRPVDGQLTYAEGVHIGYRYYLRAAIEPAFWLGHGLGYTTWSYGNPSVRGDGHEGAEVAVPVRNTGNRFGREVIQVYAARPDSTVDRPVTWLAGFATVDAQPGEQVVVTVPVAARAFQHWDPAGHRWATEPGPFELHLARSASERLACVPFEPDRHGVAGAAPAGHRS